jgi:hypothetical protein
MEYYLTRMRCKVEILGETIEVTQLVKASSPEMARKAVENAARKEKGDSIVIFEIRVNETIAGE